MEEFKKIGVEALLLTPSIPTEGALSGGLQEVQTDRRGRVEVEATRPPWSYTVQHAVTEMILRSGSLLTREHAWKLKLPPQVWSGGTRPGQPTTGPVWYSTVLGASRVGDPANLSCQSYYQILCQIL